jgi:hypothetical protein
LGRGGRAIALSRISFERRLEEIEKKEPIEMRSRHITLSLLVIVLLGVVPAFASHGWSSYHWGRSCSTCPANITVYDTTATTNTNWSDHLTKSLFGDPANPNSVNRRGWNDSAALTLTGTSSTASRSTCAAVSNAVRVCNYTYGSTGWLGLAQINTVSGTSHIAWGTAKMNDTYFNGGSYPNTEKRHVMCQEVGHDFGLGHTSENGSSQNTCMDYYSNTSNSDWTSTGPNQHDFDQLLTQHHWGAALPPVALSISEISTAFDDDGNFSEPWQWGTPFEWDDRGRAVGYELEIGGNTLYTFVTWAEPEREQRTPRTLAEEK